MLILSLFPGLELLDRAFREQGWCVVAGPDRLLGGDVRDFHPPPGRFDGVIGGSPCQAFSALANLVRAKGLEPRFGDLVPEFERVVVEAAPAWFLHENVPRAPIPRPAGYAVKDFVICNSSIEGDDGLGQEQERVRRFTFGVRGEGTAPCLLRWIPRAALRLPEMAKSVFGDGRETRDRPKMRTQAVVADARAVPVALGGSGKPKRTRAPAVQGSSPTPADRMSTKEALRLRQPTLPLAGGARSVTADTGGRRDPPGRRPGSTPRRSLAEMLRLQGLPEDMLDEQWTAEQEERDSEEFARELREKALDKPTPSV